MQNVIRNSVRSRVSNHHHHRIRPQSTSATSATSEVLASESDRKKKSNSSSKFSQEKYSEEKQNSHPTSTEEVFKEVFEEISEKVFDTPELRQRRVISPINPDFQQKTSSPLGKNSSVHSNLGELGDIRIGPVGKPPDIMMDSMSRPNSESQSHSRLYKILVLGEVHTGKSAIIRRFVHNFFHENYHSTVGVDFHVKLVPFNDEMEVRLQLWDIAGQERFTQMTRAYFKGAVGALVIFDLNNAQSFDGVSKWKKDIDEKCFLPDGKKIPTILLANKCDLNRDPRLPDDMNISQFVQENGFVPKWFKTSASTGEGIEESMRIMVQYIMAMDSWNQPVLNPDWEDPLSSEFGTNTLKLNELEKIKNKPNVKKCSC